MSGSCALKTDWLVCSFYVVSVQSSVWSPRRLGFSPRRILVEFVVDEVTLRWVLLGVLPFYLASIVPPIFQSFIYHRRYDLRK